MFYLYEMQIGSINNIMKNVLKPIGERFGNNSEWPCNKADCEILRYPFCSIRLVNKEMMWNLEPCKLSRDCETSPNIHQLIFNCLSTFLRNAIGIPLGPGALSSYPPLRKKLLFWFPQPKRSFQPCCCPRSQGFSSPYRKWSMHSRFFGERSRK